MMIHRHLREEPYCWPKRRGDRFHDKEMNYDRVNGMGFGVGDFVLQREYSCWLGLLEPSSSEIKINIRFE